jgi:hypothetical protein
MPTVQMVFRRGQKNLQEKKDYLSSKAHPPVFAGASLDVMKMIKIANELTPADIVPAISLTVQEESGPHEGIDLDTQVIPDTLFNTPASIARVIRHSAYEKRMVISAGESGKPSGQSLTYYWIILQGDPDRITISHPDGNRAVADIRVGWHAPYPSPHRGAFTTSRVDIAVIADNGRGYSAPAIISYLFPRSQKRLYHTDGRVLAIDHRNTDKAYDDPRLFPQRNWRDDFHYNDAGALTGWVRTDNSGTRDFSRHGALVVSKDSLGRPVNALRMGYQYARNNQGRLIVTEKPTSQTMTYQYVDDKDRLGLVLP